MEFKTWFYFTGLTPWHHMTLEFFFVFSFKIELRFRCDHKILATFLWGRNNKTDESICGQFFLGQKHSSFFIRFYWKLSWFEWRPGVNFINVKRARFLYSASSSHISNVLIVIYFILLVWCWTEPCIRIMYLFY